jgi:hypothetical protein
VAGGGGPRHCAEVHTPFSFGYDSNFCADFARSQIPHYYYFKRGIFAFNLKFLKKVSQKFGSFVIPTVVVVKGEQESHHPKGV